MTPEFWRGKRVILTGHTGFKGFLPAAGAQAPAVAGFEARKAVFGARGDQVVAPLQREI